MGQDPGLLENQVDHMTPRAAEVHLVGRADTDSLRPCGVPQRGVLPDQHGPEMMYRANANDVFLKVG